MTGVRKAVVCAILELKIANFGRIGIVLWALDVSRGVLRVVTSAEVEVGVVHGLGHAEAGDAHLVVLAHQDVASAEVPVHELLLLHVRHRVRYLEHKHKHITVNRPNNWKEAIKH